MNNSSPNTGPEMSPDVDFLLSDISPDELQVSSREQEISQFVREKLLPRFHNDTGVPPGFRKES